ncbi:MAG: hypothetical protein MMC33_003557 [Icmadophila ericetorum]|nr:hypothetical protein [Icmadophila ericetorum]
MPPSSSPFQDDSIYSFPGPQQYNIFASANMPTQISNVRMILYFPLTASEKTPRVFYPGAIISRAVQVFSILEATTQGGPNSNANQLYLQAEKQSLIRSLTTHSVNTLIELRRIERVIAPYGTTEIQGALETAWAYYVNSNNLLSELRGLTRNYPFSSEALDEAKWAVMSDPASNRSWNYCWLVLVKIRDQQLIARHAQQLAARREMWGGKTPSAAMVQQLATACMSEWTRALSQLLRNWEVPPTTSGY